MFQSKCQVHCSKIQVLQVLKCSPVRKSSHAFKKSAFQRFPYISNFELCSSLHCGTVKKGVVHQVYIVLLIPTSSSLGLHQLVWYIIESVEPGYQAFHPDIDSTIPVSSSNVSLFKSSETLRSTRFHLQWIAISKMCRTLRSSLSLSIIPWSTRIQKPSRIQQEQQIAATVPNSMEVPNPEKAMNSVVLPDPPSNTGQ